LSSNETEQVFIDFFYKLREFGVPVSPTAFLTLTRALHCGLIKDIDDFYLAARAILVKSERHFDQYDQVFVGYFEEGAASALKEDGIGDTTWQMLEQWLRSSGETAAMPGEDTEKLRKLSVEDLLAYFRDRLAEQHEEHHGGARWIGTGGTSPVGHSGFHPTPMHIAGEQGRLSAVKVAGRRRYKDYAGQGGLNQNRIGEALKRLKKLVPSGARDQLNVGRTISRTVELGGEIEIVFDQGLKDRLKVILAIDNGGWSMDPHVKLVKTLFDHARSQFKDLKIYYFHNTLYDTLWADPERSQKPFPIDDFVHDDRESRFIVVGDASMAPFELTSRDGSIHIQERSSRTSLDCLRYLAERFPHIVWLNPIPENQWHYSRSIAMIQTIFPMFELSLDGLEKAVAALVV